MMLMILRKQGIFRRRASYLQNPSVDDMYALLREYEAEIQQNHLAANAAKQALSKGLSFPEVYSSLKTGSSRMPSFDELIRMQTKGGNGLLQREVMPAQVWK